MTVQLSFLRSALLGVRLSHLWQAFHENVIRHNETKEHLRGRRSYLGGKMSVHVQEARGVRDWLTLSARSRLLCVRVCVCLSFATFFHLTCFNTFPLCVCPPFTSCLHHVLFCFIVCEPADFNQFQTLFSDQTIVSVMLADTLLKRWFSGRVLWMLVCHSVTGAPHETV